MSYKSFLTVIASIISTYAFAQPGSTDIWIAGIEIRNGKPVATVPERITQNDYYDNQPCFSSDGSLLYYVSMPDTIQSELFEYNIRKKSYRQLTNTLESEYQPQLMPSDKKKLSVIRVDLDKGQRFYALDILDGAYSEEPLMPNEDSVAYYCWINDTTVGAYMLNGQGGSLQQFDMKPQQAILLMNNGGFGRCLARVPGTELMSYVQKGSDGKNTIMTYDMTTEERLPVTETPEKTEDYCWGPDGKIYVGLHGKLMYFDTKATTLKWIEVADWQKVTGKFYRLAMSPDGSRIAIVTYSGDKP
jgi:Tol biopolymer transport system component